MKTLLIAATTFALGIGAHSMALQTKDQENNIQAKVWQIADVQKERQKKGGPWLEFLKVNDLSVGLYELKKGQRDGQRPHARDEVYYVVRGKATFESAGRKTSLKPGSVIYVKKQVEHRFVDITEDLSVVVMFATSPAKPKPRQPAKTK